MKGTKVTHIKLSTLIRRASRRNQSPNTESSSNQQGGSADQNDTCETVPDQFIPTLNFVAATTEGAGGAAAALSSSENVQTKPRNRSKKKDKSSKKSERSFLKEQDSKKVVAENSEIMDDSKKSDSVDEEIEEVITASSITSSSSGKKNKNAESVNRQKKLLFDIDDDDLFKIDDDQLSGGKLTQHFKVDESGSSSRNQSSKSIRLEKAKSFPQSTETKNKLTCRINSEPEKSEHSSPDFKLQSIKLEPLKTESRKNVILKPFNLDLNTTSLNITSDKNNKANSSPVNKIGKHETSNFIKHEKQSEELLKQGGLKKTTDIPTHNKIHREFEDMPKKVLPITSADPQDDEDQSLTNQSTANDISELLEEFTSNSPQNSKSIDLSGSKDVNYENPQSLETNSDFIGHDQNEISSLEQVPQSNDILDLTLKDTDNLSALSAHINIDDESQINKILDETILNNSHSSGISSSQEDNDIEVLKQKILSLRHSPQKTGGPHLARDISFEQTEDQNIAVKQMERIHSDFSKEILEDITEESEKVSTTTAAGPYDSLVSLNMIQNLENKVKELEDVVASKDICLTALNMQLDSQKRDSQSTVNESHPASGRDSSSLATNSTEYQTVQEQLGHKLFDFHNELTQRDNLIEKLTESLQQSIQNRGTLQHESEKLSNEVDLLKKQLVEALESTKKPYWPNRDQESSNCQRLSEISIDLVSESDEDLERNFSTDNEDKFSRASKERSVEYSGLHENYEPQLPISKQIEQFQKYLNPDELRIFFMVQKKFDDFLSEELEKNKMKLDGELKIFSDGMEIEKKEREIEIKRLKQLLTTVNSGSTELIQLRNELEDVHSKEMKELREYFEKKCSDLEKQFSEEVFSQQSQRNNDIDNSDFSEQENIPEENLCGFKSKEGSPRKRTREELYSSPSHRQMTPTTISPEIELNRISLADLKMMEEDPKITVEELKTFYNEKMREINLNNEEIVKKLTEKLKRYESKYADEKFMKIKRLSQTMMNEKKNIVKKIQNEEDQIHTSSYIIVDEDEIIQNDGFEINKIAAEYDRRLQEQVRLAKEDLIKELELQIQALLSETTSDDHHWPPELILLREKFTAKSQLEIAQIQIKHEEEMSRLKNDIEKQFNRKIKRQSTFDSSRDLDDIMLERDGLRELSSSLRYILGKLARCVSTCELDLNRTLFEQLQKFTSSQNESFETGEPAPTLNNITLSENLIHYSKENIPTIPDVSNLLSLIEDPNLISFINNENDNSIDFSLKDWLGKLQSEAQQLLELTEDICRRKIDKNDSTEKNDSCEEEDGLKRTPQKVIRAHSMNENILLRSEKLRPNHMFSLPPDLNRLKITCAESILEDFTSTGPVSELNFQVHELKNRLVKSESDRFKLQQELEITIKRNCELGIELAALRDQLDQLDSTKEDYSEGYGLGEFKSPLRIKSAKTSTSFTNLQEKARNVLNTPTRNENMTTNLLQMIEDFCREGDKVMEDSKKDRDDLQAQIDAADKQLKATRQFLEDQAAERELERDEFLKEIEKLKNQLRDKEKERTSLQNVSKEVEQMDNLIKDLTRQVKDNEAKKDKLEIELKASIDKIFVLREIISELEMQVETKALNEHVLNEKNKELEQYVSKQNVSNETLQQEVESLKTEIGQGYLERIAQLEESLRNSRPPAEQSAMLKQFGEQLRDIAVTLEQKIKTLELLHQSVASVSCSTNGSEDVSVQGKIKSKIPSAASEESPQHGGVSSLKQNSLPLEEIQQVFEKLSKHTRVEEAAIKRIKDLEMLMGNIRGAYGELQQERDILQERMSEQMMRISTLQTKLDEQRRRAEDIQRIGTSDLNIRIHDLQTDVQNLTETLSARDKQILNLRNHLEQSKSVIDRQENEIAIGFRSDRNIIDKFESELKMKTDENRKLKEKIKNDMINKVSLPDLMETMLADKNEEIDHLKDQLDSKEKELQSLLEINLSQGSSNEKADRKKDDNGTRNSGRTLSDIVSISDFDEPDVVRRAPLELESPLVLPDPPYPEQTMESSKIANANLSEKRTEELQLFQSIQSQPTFVGPNFFATGHSSTIPNSASVDSFRPRQINFSEFADDSKIKDSTPKKQKLLDDGELQMKLKDAEIEIDGLKNNIETLDREKTDEIQKLSQNIQDQLKNYNQLLIEKQELSERIKLLNIDLEENEKLKAELYAKNNKLQKIEDEFIENKLKLALYEDELSKKSVQIKDLTSERNQLLENLATLKNLTENNNEKLIEMEKTISKKNEIIENKDELIMKREKELENQLQMQNPLTIKKCSDSSQVNLADSLDDFNIEQSMSKKTITANSGIINFPVVEDALDQLKEELSRKERELEQFKDLPRRIDNLTEKLNLINGELNEKSFAFEKSQLDLRSLQNDIIILQNNIAAKDKIICSMASDSQSLQTVLTSIQHKLNDANSLNDLKLKLSESETKISELEKCNAVLEGEIEKLKAQNSESSKPFSLDEIAQQVEKELNYSAQLDNNILKAIESEEDNNLQIKTEDSEKIFELRQLQDQLKLSNDQLEIEKSHNVALQQELKNEKTRSQEIQEQDVAIIEAMRVRLEEAMGKEQELHNQVDQEREKCERLATQISVLHRSEARKTSLLLKSPPESPKKSLRTLDFENDAVERLKGEIKLLNAQIEREKERNCDSSRVLDREKLRFETELKDRIEYGEKLKNEMEKVSREKELCDQQLEQLQEHLLFQSQEIGSLERRISTLQEAETRKAQRRDKERSETVQNAIELQELKSKLQAIETEREHSSQTIDILRADIDRGAIREARLAESLVNVDSSIPQQFLQKMKEMNSLLLENTNENRQMAETVHILIEERKTLQRKVEDLESQLGSGQSSNELEDRANHLFGRYLRVESHRKALVHQKRYLLIALKSYQETEVKALALLNGSGGEIKEPRKNLFKCAALVIVAIQRMKYVVNRWHTGKRVISSRIYTVTQQKRCPSTSSTAYNVQMTPTGQQQPPISLSPPCRDISNQNNQASQQQQQLKALQQTHFPSEIQVKTPPSSSATTTFANLRNNGNKIDWIRLNKK